jgi:nitroreductase
MEETVEIPFDRWYPAITSRRSRRQFEASQAIPSEILARIQKVCEEFRPFPGARVELVTHSTERIFKGIVGSYGKVKHAAAYLAFIGNSQSPNFQESTGYCGEGIILEATSQGLGTCWVAGFFRPQAVAQDIKMEPTERVLAVSPIGYSREFSTLEEKLMSGFARSRQRKPLSVMVEGLPENDWPAWVKPVVEAARQAPSATNRQPWKFRIEPEAVTVSIRGVSPDFNVSKRLDCGIAMTHLEVAALSQGLRGKWEFLESPQVARLKW